MSNDNNSRRRFRQLPSGQREFDDGKDRGDGRTSLGTFPKGKSGNIRGRPSGALNASTVIRRELSERVIMKGPSGNQSKSKFAAAVIKLANLGLTQNNVRALERIIALGLSVEEKDSGAKPVLPLNDADRAAIALIAKRLAAAASTEVPSDD